MLISGMEGFSAGESDSEVFISTRQSNKPIPAFNLEIYLVLKQNECNRGLRIVEKCRGTNCVNNPKYQ